MASKRIRQALATAIIVVSAAIAGTVALKQFRSAAPESAPRNSSPEIDMAMSGASFSEMRGETKLWSLTAEKAEYDKQSGSVRLEKVRTELYEGKAGGMVITSQTGSYDEGSRIVRMNGQVHCVTRRGMVLDTDALEYRAAEGVVLTDRPVRVVDGRLTLKAQGMDLTVKDEQVRFHHQVQAVIEGYHAKR
jgi:LPS export ABC transporter protein LptC